MKKLVYVFWFCVTLITGFSVMAQANKDLFEANPKAARPNCSQEYRFKYEVSLNSIDEFISFLKMHQSEGSIVEFTPTQEFLVPRSTSGFSEDKTIKTIDLEALKGKVEIMDLENSSLSNKKIFILKIWYKDFDEGYPWRVMVMVSNNGHVSVTHCAGI